MKRITTLLAISAATFVSAFAQPVINSGGVLNAASYARPGLPNYGVAQGALFVVFGQRLGPAAIAQVGAFPLPTSIGGTSIKVTVGGAAVDALMIYSLAGQVAAIMPSNTPVGDGTLTVTYNGQTSTTATVRVVRSAFGTFSVNQAGSGPGIVQNVNSESDRPVNALTKAARPGQVMILWGTGLGAVAGEAAGPVPGDLGGNVEVYVGGKLARVTYKGRSGCCAGIDQIVFETPADVEGCYVPVVVKTGDVVSNFTTISVARSGSACSDPNGITAQDLQIAEQKGSFSAGYISLVRSNSKLSVAGFNLETKSDTGGASFDRYTLNQLLSSQGRGGGFASIGACTVFTGSEASLEDVDPVKPVSLDAGPSLTVTGPKGAKQLTKQSSGGYSAELGGGAAFPGGPAPLPDYLDAGAYTVTGTGGSGPNAVGAFTANLTLPPNLLWTNQDSIDSVNRAQGVQVTWSGGDPNGFVNILGAAVSTSPKVTAGFVCSEKASAGRFTVPAIVLLNLPASAGQDIGILSLSSNGGDAKFTATGIDTGIITGSTSYLKTVSYR